MITERKVKTHYGEFTFSYIDYPGPSGMLDVYFGAEHLGYLEFINLEQATDSELIYKVSSAFFMEEEVDEDE